MSLKFFASCMVKLRYLKLEGSLDVEYLIGGETSSLPSLL
jgi:hypothetical protein